MGKSRSLLRLLGGAVGAGAGAAVAYRLLTERWDLSVTRATFGITNLPPDLEGLTIAHLTDFHVGPQTPVSFVELAVSRTDNLRPEVVVLTGDYVEDEGDDLAGCARALGKLWAPRGVFAVLGNHDYTYGAEAVAEALSAQGIRVLRNATASLGNGERKLWLAGLEDTASHREEFSATLAAIPAGQPVIVLSHSPDLLPRAADAGLDLVLSGHTHGGQVRLPWLGAPHAPSAVGPRYESGGWRMGNTRLYVNRGIGMTALAVRFSCPPEIGLFTLQGTVR